MQQVMQTSLQILIDCLNLLLLLLNRLDAELLAKELGSRGGLFLVERELSKLILAFLGCKQVDFAEVWHRLGTKG